MKNNAKTYFSHYDIRHNTIHTRKLTENCQLGPVHRSNTSVQFPTLISP